ncbi:MAG: ABC transporter permease [Burkholderiaceae bacterium]
MARSAASLGTPPLRSSDTRAPRGAHPPTTEAGAGRRRTAASPAQRWLFAIVAAGTAGLVLYPILMFVIGSVRTAPWGEPDAAWTLAGYLDAYGDAHTWKLVLNTFLIGGMALAGIMLVGLFFAWLITRTDAPCKPVLEVVAIAPYFLPAVVSGVSWAILANPRNGLLNNWLSALLGTQVAPINIYSHVGIAFVLVSYIAPMAYLLMVPMFRNVDSSIEESACMSGASSWLTLRRVTLPVLAPAILGVGILMAIKSLEPFEVPFLLGMPSRINVFTTEIYAALTFTPPADYARATALAMLLVIVTATMVLPLQRYLSRNQRSFVTIKGKGHVTRLTRLGRWRWPLFALCLLYGVVVLVLPLYTIAISSVSKVFGSFAPGNFTIANFQEVLSAPLLRRGLINSIVLGLLGATLTCAWAVLVAYVVHRTRFAGRQVIDFVSYLPISIPGLVIGLALLWAYLGTPALSWMYGTRWILVVAYVTVTLPFALRALSATMVQLDPELEEAARMSGARFGTLWRRVLLPLMRPSLIAAWTLVFIMIIREVGASILLYTTDSVVLSVLVIDSWNSGAFGIVAAMSCYMMFVIGAAVLLRRIVTWRFERVSWSRGV